MSYLFEHYKFKKKKVSTVSAIEIFRVNLYFLKWNFWFILQNTRYVYLLGIYQQKHLKYH